MFGLSFQFLVALEHGQMHPTTESPTEFAYWVSDDKGFGPVFAKVDPKVRPW